MLNQEIFFDEVEELCIDGWKIKHIIALALMNVADIMWTCKGLWIDLLHVRCIYRSSNNRFSRWFAELSHIYFIESSESMKQ